MLNDLETALIENNFTNYNDIKTWLETRYEQTFKYSTVHQAVRYRLKAKQKVARPSAVARCENKAVIFKKNSAVR